MNGVIVVNKPREFTSFDVVAVMRGCFKTKKVGHSGTLDPMATGVLPVFIGGATKAVDTLDIWGSCSEQKNADISSEMLLNVLERFKGDIEQVPPMYSALKVNGQKLCDLARKGIEVERKPRPVTVSRLDLIGFDGRDGIIDVDCSSGTYIRSLIDDIGAALGTGAVMTSLVRTCACGFLLSESYPLEELKTRSLDELERLLKPIESVFAEYPEIRLDSAQERLYLNGVRLDAKRLHGSFGDGLYRVCGGEFFGIAKIENEELVSVKRFKNGD